MSISEAFGDVASLIAQMAPEKIIALKASNIMSARVEDLIYLKKEGIISVEENTELERFLALDLFIGLAKVKAHKLMLQ